MSFKYLSLFKPNERTKDYYNRNQTIKKSQMKLMIKNIYVGEKLVSFGTTDSIVECSLIDAFNDVKYPYAHGIENIYFMLHRKKSLLKKAKLNTKRCVCLFV